MPNGGARSPLLLTIVRPRLTTAPSSGVPVLVQGTVVNAPIHLSRLEDRSTSPIAARPVSHRGMSPYPPHHEEDETAFVAVAQVGPRLLGRQLCTVASTIRGRGFDSLQRRKPHNDFFAEAAEFSPSRDLSW